MPSAVSRGHYVWKFDRRGAEVTHDLARMGPEQRKLDIHFTGVAYDQRFEVIWCGMTSFVGDLLWTFDPKTKKFKSLGFTSLKEKEEIKIHRGMHVGPDGLVYFGTASLITIPDRCDAPGGRLFRYHPKTGEYEFLGRPVEHDYIQTIEVDHERGLIYGATWPLGRFFAWDLEKKKLIFKTYIADFPYQLRLDNAGNCWGSYATWPVNGRIRLFKFSPKTKTMTCTVIGLPGDRRDPDTQIDAFVNGGDGFLYIGADTGALLRLDPKTGHLKVAARPSASRGFGALSPPINGRLYGVACRDESNEIFSYDLVSGDVVTYGPAFDAKRKTYVQRPHELVLGPGRCLYCPETDNFDRQCYFWEIELKK